MITGSYDLDTIKEAFNVVLKIDDAKVCCSKCEGYEHCNISSLKYCIFISMYLLVILLLFVNLNYSYYYN